MLRDFSLIFMAIAATSAIIFAWDSEYGIPLRQLVLVLGGVFMGHIITEVLNLVRDADE
jgi:hypothetical protein